jgi:outer membrane protein OmpA-like peptidoglycan-associated protein
MSKMSYLLGIALTIILGVFFYQKFCANCCTDNPNVEKETVIPAVPADSVSTVTTTTDTVADTTAVKSSTTDWSALREKINAEPLVLYFNTAASNIELTDVEKQKVADLAAYIKNVPNAAILAVGHTDNVGGRELNINLGQRRAEFAKNYLAENGIDAGKISTDSKGPDEPIADNATNEGKAKNRRVVITIK